MSEQPMNPPGGATGSRTGSRSKARVANRLVHETSPYLLQHAYNPVDWYPWGPEALERAREEDKPIFLSIGYSACHWCHVMERESFEDVAIAGWLNGGFISIKVDREERPDLDLIYQRVAQVTGTPGGWPLSVFLLPDARPFWVGTYLPPEDRYGRPGFPRLLEGVLKAFRERREELEDIAGRIVAALEIIERPAGERPPELRPEFSGGREAGKATGTTGVSGSGAAGDGEAGAAADAAGTGAAADAAGTGAAGGPGASEGAGELREAARTLLRGFDPKNGGFGRQPKFPQTSALELVWRDALRNGDPEGERRVLFTLRKMAHGGIYDQLGGGFHRYAVDAAWQVPHFEKMLYDNALLPPLYLAAYRRTGDEEWARVARETLDYILREMTAPGGGFYSAQDADTSEGEGAFFVWNPAQLREVLGEDDAHLAALHFGVSERGNFEQGMTVLHIARPAGDLAEELGRPADRVHSRLSEIRAKLLKARGRRIPPATDTKILTAWNGMMIAAMAEAGWTLAEPRYLEAAAAAAGFILSSLTDSSGGLLHVHKDGRSRVPGMLDDYAFMVLGLIRLHQATLDPRWVHTAVRLAEEMIRRFWDDEAGCFYYTPASSSTRVASDAGASSSTRSRTATSEDVAGRMGDDGGESDAVGPAAELIYRPRELHDTSTPAATSAAALALLRLAPFAPHLRAERRVAQLLERYAPDRRANPYAFASQVLVADEARSGTLEVTLAAGGPAARGTGAATTSGALATEAGAGDAAEAELRRWHAWLGRQELPGLLVTRVPAGQSPDDPDAPPIWRGRGPVGGRATAYVCREFACSAPLHDLSQLEQALSGKG